MGECQFPPAVIQACFILHTGCFRSQFLKVLFEDWQQKASKLLCSIFWCLQCARWLHVKGKVSLMVAQLQRLSPAQQCSSALWSILASCSSCFGFTARSCHQHCKITFCTFPRTTYMMRFLMLQLSTSNKFLCFIFSFYGLVRFRNKKTVGGVSTNCPEPHSQKILVADKMGDLNRDSWWSKRSDPIRGASLLQTIRATSWSLLLMLFFIRQKQLQQRSLSQSQSGWNNFILILKQILLVHNCLNHITIDIGGVQADGEADILPLEHSATCSGWICVARE